MKSQFSKRSPFKRIAVWLVIQTPIVLYLLVAAGLSSWHGKPKNPLSGESIAFIKIQPSYLHDALGFMIFYLIAFSLIYIFAAWRTRDRKIGVSGYSSVLLVSFFFGIPVIAITHLFAQDALQSMGVHDARDPLVSVLLHFSSSDLSGLILGGALILIAALILTRKLPKPAAMLRLSSIAGAAAVLYICFGLIRLAVIQFRPEWIFPYHQEHYDLIGGGLALLSGSIGLGWTLSAVFQNRANASGQICTNCGCNPTGVTSKCPECGTDITPQSA